MLFKSLRIMRKSTSHILEGLAYVLVIVVLGLSGFAIRLSQSPVNLDFAKGYILGALSDKSSGVVIQVQNIQISWPDLNEEINLDLDRISLRAASGARLSINKARIGVAKGPLLFGVIRPKTITLIEPRFRFTRRASAQGEVNVVSEAENENALLDFLGGAMIDMKEGRETIFTRIQKIAIENANIRYHDTQAGWLLNLFQTDIAFTRQGRNLSYRLSVPGGVIENAGLFQESVTIDSIVIDGQYDAKLHQVLLNTPSGKIANLPLKIQGLFNYKESGFEGGAIALLDEIETDRIDELWPKGHENSDGYDWFVKKLSKGKLKNIKVETPLAFTVRHDGISFRIDLPQAQFDFDNLSVDYRPPLDAYAGAKGSAIFKDDNLEVLSEGGKIGTLDVVKARVYLDQLMATGVGDAQIDVTLSGALRDVFEYARKDPINLDKKFKVVTQGIQGSGQYQVGINFPAIPELLAEQVKVAVDAKVQDATIPDVANGLSLENAALDISSKGGVVHVKGEGQVLDREVKLDWTRQLEAATGNDVKAKILLQVSSDDILRKAFGADIPELQGVVPLDLDITDKQDGSSLMILKGDLTPSTIDIAPLGYKKLPGLSGAVEGTLRMRDGHLNKVDGMNVRANGLSLEGISLDYALGKDNLSSLKAGSIAQIKTDETTLKLEFIKPADDFLSIVASGPKVDLRPLLKNKDKKDPNKTQEGQRIRMKLSAPVALGVEKESLQDLVLDIDLNEFGTMTGIELQAKAGTGPVTVYYRPDSDKPQKFTLHAADAGATLRAFGIYPNILGGTMDMNADTIQAGLRDLKGKLEIKDFRVVRAPFLARLIGALSMQGLGQTLQGTEGLPFAKLQSDFEWYSQEKGSLYIFRDGRTSGSSLGLTFEGKADQSTKTVDFSGTIVPVSGVNGLVTNIPILGQILAGNKGDGVFAATYSLQGPSDNPEATVNPLSVLTPGILRKILFERDVSIPDKPTKQEKTETDIQSENKAQLKDTPKQAPLQQDPLKSDLQIKSNE